MTTFQEIKQELVLKIGKTSEALKKDFAGLRTGRASAGLLDTIMVDAYGSIVPLNQVGNVSVPEARMLTVQVWDKNLIKHVEKAILESDLGLNPTNDGSLIRIAIPPLSEERRLELIRVAGRYTETARVSVRQLRRDALDALKEMKKKGEISEDDLSRHETEVQTLVDNAIKALDEALKSKEAEMKQV